MKTLTLTFLCLSTAAFAGEWLNISDSVTTRVKPGIYGPTAGITVDRVNGDLFMVVNDQGLWRSHDQGATFERCDGKTIGGRCETGWALNVDPAGRRLACFMIYGDSAMTTDGGETWTKFKTSHLDYGAVDWADTGKRLLALRHESGGMLTTSNDGGLTWTDLEKGFSGCGVLDSTTFVATKMKEPGIFRSTDAGLNWTKVFNETPASPVPVLFENAAYWALGKGLLISQDRGVTWSLQGNPVEASYGPFFHTAQHFVVAGRSGFSETTDAGKTWQAAVPLPPGFVINRVGPNYAWDPRSATFYSSTMNKPAFSFKAH
ncbi:MAG: BNR/Asp-box repeat protein [Chthoniobacteraceae bacterium]|nr:BNR/Asp-box repeat protein [Chthoniobacteraceae bacterium]